mmetsp:Transcript_3917/g.9115  ORF Transcript_3917/g.9115 Transcript_3917/m.9115 type:complete len:242 (-) Transcript_3917:594-1319(-)
MLPIIRQPVHFQAGGHVLTDSLPDLLCELPVDVVERQSTITPIAMRVPCLAISDRLCLCNEPQTLPPCQDTHQLYAEVVHKVARSHRVRTVVATKPLTHRRVRYCRVLRQSIVCRESGKKPCGQGLCRHILVPLLRDLDSCTVSELTLPATLPQLPQERLIRLHVGTLLSKLIQRIVWFKLTGTHQVRDDHACRSRPALLTMDEDSTPTGEGFGNERQCLRHDRAEIRDKRVLDFALKMLD